MRYLPNNVQRPKWGESNDRNELFFFLLFFLGGWGVGYLFFFFLVTVMLPRPLVPSCESQELSNVLPFKAKSKSTYSYACFIYSGQKCCLISHFCLTVAQKDAWSFFVCLFVCFVLFLIGGLRTSFICVLSPARGCEMRGSRVYLLIVKYLSLWFCLNSATEYITLDGLVADFGRMGGKVFFFKDFGGVCWPYHLQRLHSVSDPVNFLQSGTWDVQVLGISDPLHLYSPSQYFRSSVDTCLLKLQLYKCKTKSDRAFSYFGPSVWNSLPLHIRKSTTIDAFKSALRTHLFNLQEFD